MSDSGHFSSQLFEFLRDLKLNNDREWFALNKERYQAHVRDPLLEFIADFGTRLGDISRRFVADARPNGGSMFRIYRDVRFSKDKSPYKTMAAVHFRHERARDVHAPGFYLHLEPESVFCGVGIWRPDSGTLGKIRDTMVARPERWQAVKANSRFTQLYRLEGESLKRPPKGYDPEHPLIEDLKRKDFLAVAPFSEDEACDPDFIERFAETCRAASPFMEYLTRAVGLEW